MDFYVIRRPSAWRNQEELKAAKAKFAEVTEELSGRLRWIRTYVVDEADGRLGSFSVYQAQDIEAIRELTRRVGMPAAEFYRINSTLIVNEDFSGGPVASAGSDSRSSLPAPQPKTLAVT